MYIVHNQSSAVIRLVCSLVCYQISAGTVSHAAGHVIRKHLQNSSVSFLLSLSGLFY